MTARPSFSTRARLPGRRESDTVKVRSIRLDKTLHLTVSRFADGAISEVFVSGAKVGSDSESILSEWATLLSIALQRGMPLAEYAPNVHREKDGTPITVLGEIIDELLRL